MNAIKAEGCSCGKSHKSEVKNVIIGKGVLSQLPEELVRLGAKKVFVLADVNTYAAAGEAAVALLAEHKIPHTTYVFKNPSLEPNEEAVGSAVMHFDKSCDTVLAIGSGVIGDISKILATLTKSLYVIVATAPSMDGYASGTSSMAMDGVKVSLNTKCPETIIGDVNILKNAPREMLISGLGDMLAKYISIGEWRIANIVIGEYYCEDVANLMRTSLKQCVENADGLLNREEDAVEAVFRGLVLAGMAMSYAGVSRPASGVEHYFSHIWDMRGLEFGDKTSTHGIQCAIATLYAARLYERILTLTPDRARAIAYAEQFDGADWASQLSSFLGKSADAMIELEKKEQKYAVAPHHARLEVILEKWDEILSIIREEIPSSAELEALLDRIGCPKTSAEIGIPESLLPMTFRATKDIRDKYVLSRLAFDLGVIDEFAESL